MFLRLGKQKPLCPPRPTHFAAINSNRDRPTNMEMDLSLAVVLKLTQATHTARTHPHSFALINKYI